MPPRPALIAGDRSLRAHLLIMKTNCLPASKPESPQIQAPCRQGLSPLRLAGALALGGILLSIAAVQAGTLSWDANTNGAPSDGSGTWHVNPWWNGLADVPRAN